MRGSHRAIPTLNLNFMYAYKNVPTDRLKFSSARALNFQKMRIFRVWFNSFLYNLHFSLVLKEIDTNFASSLEQRHRLYIQIIYAGDIEVFTWLQFHSKGFCSHTYTLEIILPCEKQMLVG